jgi:mono/diheme cytochrome c family protein
MLAKRLLLAFVVVGALSAQHGYTPLDVETGGFFYRTNCMSCHGPQNAFPVFHRPLVESAHFVKRRHHGRPIVVAG